jgi:cytochrome c biogenesis protein CcdA
MNFLTSLLENSNMPWLSALLLGLMTAISPCPLATNITAIAYIGKDIQDRKKVFINGIFYTLGRSISYTLLAFLIFCGADQFKFSGFFQQYGEKVIGPFLILIGFLMLEVISLNFPSLSSAGSKFQSKIKNGYIYSILLGMIFALAFCPYSGVLYFGMLIPMTVINASGLYLPIIFAVATGIPVLIFAWMLAFSIHSTGRFYSRLKNFEFWFRRSVAALFILIGIYYVVRVF